MRTRLQRGTDSGDTHARGAAALAGLAAAQQTNVGLPFHTASNRLLRTVWRQFWIQSHNFFFQQNSLGLAAPPLAASRRNAAATTGFSIRSAVARHSSTYRPVRAAKGVSFRRLLARR